MNIFEYGEKEINYLKKKDKRLAALIDRIGMIKRDVTPDLLTALMNSVIGQQISNKAAATVRLRFSELLKGHVTAEKILALPDEEIRKCGISARKVSYMKSIAQAIHKGEVDIEALPRLSDEEIIEKLTSLKGIGIWTAEMIMIFSMQRPDVLSWGDLAIKRGLCRLYGHKELDRVKFERYKKRYSPYGSVASLYLWALAAE